MFKLSPTHQVVLLLLLLVLVLVLVLVRVLAVTSHHRADDSAHRPHQRHRAQAHAPAAQRLQIMGPVLGSTQQSKHCLPGQAMPEGNSAYLPLHSCA